MSELKAERGAAVLKCTAAMGSHAFLGTAWFAVLPLALTSFWACSSSSGGSSGGTTYKDDSGIEHTGDGGLSAQGCFDLADIVGAAKVNAKACANVPGVCTQTIDDECGCPVFVEDPNNDYAKQFQESAQRLADSNCAKKCGDCAKADHGICEPQPKGPSQCVP
jgi:hypothetical protein